MSLQNIGISVYWSFSVPNYFSLCNYASISTSYLFLSLSHHLNMTLGIMLDLNFAGHICFLLILLRMLIVINCVGHNCMLLYCSTDNDACYGAGQDACYGAGLYACYCAGHEDCY